MDSWISTAMPRLGLAWTWTFGKHQKLFPFWSSAQFGSLLLSWSACLNWELLSFAHSSTDPQGTNKERSPAPSWYACTPDRPACHVWTSPRKPGSSVSESQHMISFCFHLCLALFCWSPWFCFWSWIMAFFSTAVRLLSTREERERRQENDLAEP